MYRSRNEALFGSNLGTGFFSKMSDERLTLALANSSVTQATFPEDATSVSSFLKIMEHWAPDARRLFVDEKLNIVRQCCHVVKKLVSKVDQGVLMRRVVLLIIFTALCLRNDLQSLTIPAITIARPSEGCFKDLVDCQTHFSKDYLDRFLVDLKTAYNILDQFKVLFVRQPELDAMMKETAVVLRDMYLKVAGFLAVRSGRVIF